MGTTSTARRTAVGLLLALLVGLLSSGLDGAGPRRARRREGARGR